MIINNWHVARMMFLCWVTDEEIRSALDEKAKWPTYEGTYSSFAVIG